MDTFGSDVIPNFSMIESGDKSGMPLMSAMVLADMFQMQTSGITLTLEQ